MSQMEFYFNKDWLKDMRREGRNPVRILEKAILNEGKYLLVKSDSVSLTIDGGEDEREQVQKWLEAQALLQFPEYLPRGEGGLWQDKTKPPVSFEEYCMGEECEARPEERKSGRKPSGKKGKKFPGPLQQYIKEWKLVVPRLKNLGQEDCLWSRNLLLAMDESYGVRDFVKELAGTLISNGYMKYTRVADGDKTIVAVKLSYPAAVDRKYEVWDRLLEKAETLESDNAKEQSKAFLLIDLVQWQPELKSSKVREYLGRLARMAGRFVCVFQLEYTREQELQEIAELMAGEMPLRLLAVPPLSREEMVEHVKNGMEKRGFRWEQESEDLLEQWLGAEQKLQYNGIRTLDKMVHNLTYQMALRSEEARNICPEAVREMLPPAKEQISPYSKLDGLIGLEEVKQQVRQIVVQIKTQQELHKAGKTVEKPAIHMMFTGNPGTGKTTVARLVAQIMKEEGVLSKGLFFEVKGRDLCGRYVGETAPKTTSYCRDAYGSVLFIDEAYALCQNKGRYDFGKEALSTLIAEMENKRDDFCVIMAGYPEDMKELFTLNSGLESRIPYQIEFPNYSREEMHRIFFRMMDGVFEYEKDLPKEVERFLKEIPDGVIQSRSFSNGRMVRNFFERVWGKAAYRRYLEKDGDLLVRREDLLAAREEQEFRQLTQADSKAKRNIGF